MTRHEKIEILILDDEKQFTEELHEFLQKSGYESFETNTYPDAKHVLDHHEIDLMILDVRLPGIDGLDILKEVKGKHPNLEVVIISAHGDMDTVIKAMRLGAFDYLRKPFRHIDIQIVVERTQKYLHLQRKLKLVEERNSLISKTLEEKIDRHFIGVSKKIRDIFDAAVAAANYPDANVLITGESGTGKENVARIIHYSSVRKDHMFCAVNSSAITDSLLESEFFGHKKGSFTGAIADKMGFFEVSNQGTLFLDEIADMPLNLQAKILRAAEEKVITRVGDTKPIRTDFRIISSTNHDIEKRVAESKFRLDLLHRLNTVRIHIPPLRERPEDIKPLLIHFTNQFAQKLNRSIAINDDVFKRLEKYDFPGNIRELKNMAERAIILCKFNSLSIEDFPLTSRTDSPVDNNTDMASLKSIEVDMIRKALLQSQFNQKAAAEILGITRDALIRKMKKYNISIGKAEN
ncbi:MAG: sigma-54 dependent transcriptional regulator [Bacteroidota bacterium]